MGLPGRSFQTVGYSPSGRGYQYVDSEEIAS
jgi:hypothetical protein